LGVGFFLPNFPIPSYLPNSWIGQGKRKGLTSLKGWNFGQRVGTSHYWLNFLPLVEGGLGLLGPGFGRSLKGFRNSLILGKPEPPFKLLKLKEREMEGDFPYFWGILLKRI